MNKKLFEKMMNKSVDFSKKEKEIIHKLLNEDILIKNDNVYEVNSKYIIGLLKFDKKYVTLTDLSNEHKSIKLEFEYLNGAFDGDLVIAKKVFHPRSKTKAKIIKVFHNPREILVYIQNNQLVTVKENIYLDVKKKIKGNEGDILLVDSKTYEIIKNIGNLDDPKVDEYISLYLYEQLHRLEKELKVDIKIDDKDQRVDLRKFNFCTIDPIGAKDHDDAIYYDWENEILYVAIADVSYFVKENTNLDRLAFTKATSLYFPSKVLPMLPSKLSENICSLKENEERYAFVFEIHLDIKNLSVKKSKMYEAIIRSKKTFSYGRIDRVLKGKLDNPTKKEEEIFNSLIKLYNITEAYRKKRLKKGYDFKITQLKLKLNHKGDLETISKENSTSSHQLIEECMLLVNTQASKKVNLVSIFRIHEQPSFKTISKLVDDVNILGVKVKIQPNVYDTISHIQEKAKQSILKNEINELIIRSQMQARYSSKNLGHFGLGFSSYCHFTSPIRRYSDLILHRILKSKQTPSNIDDICEYISVQERKIEQLVWDFEDRKYSRVAKKNIGKEFNVKIIDEQKGISKTYDKIPGMKVVLQNYQGQPLYTKLKVVIKSSNIITKQIVASIKY